jgi:deoxycytidylate deaminase
MSLNWKNLLKIAYLKAQKSTNVSTQNGAILIDGKGNVVLSAVNSFPRGIKETKASP